MKLSPEELVFIDRLRCADKIWPATRWLILIVGILLMLSPLLYVGLILLKSDAPRCFFPLIDMMGTLLPLLSLTGIFVGTYARNNWSGIPTRRLLLRLVAHAQEEPNDKE